MDETQTIPEPLKVCLCVSCKGIVRQDISHKVDFNENSKQFDAKLANVCDTCFKKLTLIS